jgi:transcriptional regulator with XRE-family HTH domain
MLTMGIRIRKLRELSGYSQDYMAKKLGISQEQYSYLETKQKTIPDGQIKTIAALLAVKEDYLRVFDPQNLIENTFNDQSQEYLNIQNHIIESHETERKFFLNLIDKLKEELKEIKQKNAGGGGKKILKSINQRYRTRPATQLHFINQTFQLFTMFTVYAINYGVVQQ